MKLNNFFLFLFTTVALAGVINQDTVDNENGIDFADDALIELNSNVDYGKSTVDVKDEADDKAVAILDILKPGILGPLLLEGKNFDYEKIGLSKKNYFIMKNVLLPRLKSKVIKEVKNELKKIRKGKSSAEIKKNYRDNIDLIAGSNLKELEDKTLKDLVKRFGNNKEYLSDIPILIIYLKDLFEGEVLKVVDEFFTECNQYRPDVAIVLKKTIDKIQSNFRIFPKDYYKSLKNAYH
ncbi:hypothetical protein K502DRAFT_330402 [Neoconidiobolus thromboides FSU 785]|nr:hypothetical protein K502DRAFT_330402 [Neoconidiobolus thromboides FSU 785]